MAMVVLRGNNSDAFMGLFAVRKADFPWAPARCHRALRCKKEEPVGANNSGFDIEGRLSIWPLGHRLILPVDVDVPPLIIEQFLQAQSKRRVLMAMAQESGGLPETLAKSPLHSASLACV